MLKEKNIYKIKYEIYNTLSTYDNMEEIINNIEHHINNPIFVLDTSYRIICKSSLSSMAESHVESHNGKEYLKLNIINLMKEHKCINTIYKSSNSFFHKAEQTLIFCAIEINNVTIGYISVLQINKEFKNTDLELIDVLSKVLSIQIQNESLFVSNTGLDEEYYLMDLLTNNIDSPEYINERFKNTSFTLKAYYIVLCIPFKQKYNDYRHNFGLKQLMRKFKDLFGNCISTYYRDMIVFLVSNDNRFILTDSIHDNLSYFLNLNNLKCGISFSFENLFNIKDYMLQASYAVNISNNIKCNDILNFFDNYVDKYFFYMYHNKDNSLYKIKFSTLINPLIYDLIKFDNNNNTQLFTTLKSYFENNRNATEASKALNIHRSTFFYRYHKIEELLNISLSKSNTLFMLEFNLKIYSYINK